MVTSTRRTERVVPPAAVAFYGRTNQRDPHDPSQDAEQYRLCLAAVADRGVISHFYDEMSHSHRRFIPMRNGSGFNVFDKLDRVLNVLAVENPSCGCRDEPVALANRTSTSEHSVRSQYACNGRLELNQGLAGEGRHGRCQSS